MKENYKITRSNITFVILWGFFMHLIFLWGVMDANFHSPIVTNLSAVPMPSSPPAKRVVVFLADGLRYRTFKHDTPPYLSSIIENKGVWGISHTRMPTESRPGNIAVVAGLYEDPSALFKGWKENPVDFDSVFNESRASWIWGSPDIIPLFTKNQRGNIHGSSYPPEWQDFSNNNSAIKHLDNWVLDKYLQWLTDEAPMHKTEDKIVIYFHLLGCDTSGHAFKPQSREYIEVMMNVDRNLQKVVERTEEFFNDNSTAYIFTSDHGMTDWGSHGSGSTDETETPLVAWGAGIAKSSHLYNVEQADLAPFISTLIGIPVPVNNEGVLPYELLDSKNEVYTAKAFLANVKQLAKQVVANRELAVGNTIVNMHSKDKEFEKKIVQVEHLLSKREIKHSIKEIKHLTSLAKETLLYYRRYQTGRFSLCLAFMWVGWIIFLFVDLSGEPRRAIHLGCFTWLRVADVALAVFLIPLLIEYLVIGCKEWRLFGYGAVCGASLWVAFRAVINKGPNFELNSNKPLIEFIGIISLILMMLLGLIYRWAFSISMLIAVGLQKVIFDRNASFALIFSGIFLALFPLLPVVGPQPRVYVVIFALVYTALLPLRQDRKIYKYNKIIEVVRLTLTSIICFNLIDGRSGLSWLLLLSTPIVILLYPKDWNQRSFGITVALLSPLALLSASYEPIFFLIFSSHLRHWPVYECTQKSASKGKALSLRDFTFAAFFMLYTLLCFFGTGNMSSLSSFDPTWTRHFLTVYSPFTMATLILLKFTMPLILVGSMICTLSPDSSIFTAVLLLGDCLAIPLMYGVTTEGSWLDIGSAISRFIIAVSLPCLLFVAHCAIKPFMTFSLQEFIRRRKIKSQRLKI
ncbi:GPI ethanolamine phosphate transferase 1-like [Copidosoma floridanum]|uniref:GPI ethanolamine phosphate transferase 1-like n=1 Tax=Copidosoma floridanum TaxID=29053 RepID=UPI0006C9C2E9|nr:GPI ethanolamine phosphate transferase 1-like [Copidosoma floridanum]XP_014214601.1 GPI ethanolamine phosphate transferase 1-like [Copidosoma floridanum]